MAVVSRPVLRLCALFMIAHHGLGAMTPALKGAALRRRMGTFVLPAARMELDEDAFRACPKLTSYPEAWGDVDTSHVTEDDDEAW